MQVKGVRVLRAEKVHIKGITEIYNEAILHSTATFDEEPKDLEEKRTWLRKHDPNHPVLVAVRAGDVVGWGSLSPHSERGCYRYTVEDSVYVKEAFRGKGIGRFLLERLIDEAEEAGHHSIIARIDAGNEVSVRMHKSLGFQEVGRLKEVGFKFGKWLDVVFMELLIQSDSTAKVAASASMGPHRVFP